MDQCEKRYTDVQRDKIIREMVVRMNALEQQTETKLKKMQNEISLLKRTRRMRTIGWLNKYVRPSKTWKQWFTELPIRNEHLEIALNHHVFHAITICLEEYLESTPPSLTDDPRPIYAFKQRREFMYVYDEVLDITQEETKYAWKLIDRKEFSQPLSTIIFRLQSMYIQWRMKNQEWISQSEDHQEEDRRNSHKMLSATMMTSAQISTVFRSVHDLINQDLEETIIDETAPQEGEPQHEPQQTNHRKSTAS